MDDGRVVTSLLSHRTGWIPSQATNLPGSSNPSESTISFSSALQQQFQQFWQSRQAQNNTNDENGESARKTTPTAQIATIRDVPAANSTRPIIDPTPSSSTSNNSNTNTAPNVAPFSGAGHTLGR